MKKALLIIVAILAVSFLLGNSELILDFVDTLSTGALIPVLIALVFTVFRYFTQAASYQAAFQAVHFRTSIWHQLSVILGLVFVNTFVVPAGTGSLPFIIGDAHKKGADAGQATSGALLSQIGFFSAVFFIAVFGMIVMIITDSFNVVVLLGFLSTTAVLVVEVGFFIIGYFWPRFLTKLLNLVEKVINWFLKLIRRDPLVDWGQNTANSFIDSSEVLAHNVSGIFITIGWAILSALMNMGCLIAIGFAFGYEQVIPLIAGFTVTVVSIMLAPTPQGVGVTEAALALVLTAYGSDLTTSAAIALVYRGIMLWIPFCVGAALLSQTGFFKGKKDPSVERKHKDMGWICGTLMALLGLVNIAIAYLDTELDSYTVVTQFVDLSTLLVGPALVVSGIILILLAIGLVLRWRIAWIVSMTVLVLLSGAEFLFSSTIKVAIPLLALAVWLFIQRHAFDRPSPVGLYLRAKSGAEPHSPEHMVYKEENLPAEIPPGAEATYKANLNLETQPSIDRYATTPKDASEDLFELEEYINDYVEEISDDVAREKRRRD